MPIELIARGLKLDGKSKLNAHFERATHATSRCVVITDHLQPDDPISFINPAFTELTGYSREDAIGRNCRFLQGPETDLAVAAEIGAAVIAGRSIQREILNYRKNGEPFWNDLAIDPITDPDGQLIGFVSSQSDVSGKKNAALAQAEIEKQLHVIDNNLPGFIYQLALKPNGKVEFPYVSASLLHILELPANTTLTESRFLQRVHPEDRNRIAAAVKSSAARRSIFYEEYRLIASNGDTRWFRSHSIPRDTSAGDIIWEGIAIEITAEKSGQIRLAYIESHDPLTGLQNRQSFHDAVKKAVETRISETGTVLFYIDLDDFGALNAPRGYSFGDRILRRVGLRLSEFAETHGGVAGRLGGDEFAVLFAIRPSDVTELQLAGAIYRALARPMTIDAEEVVLEACIGAASYHHGDLGFADNSGDCVTELTMRANLALATAKRDGPNICRAYTKEVDDRLRNRAQLRKSLQRAITEQQFVLHYQPVVDLVSGQIIGMEALVRWCHPDFGLQRPDFFIPLAESTGLIVPLGAWVLKQTMLQARLWAAQGIKVPHIALNVSSIQLNKPGFVEMVEAALVDTGVNPAGFELELTESVLIEGSIDIRRQLTQLKSLGFSISIDDFGTGHSNFKYLQEFPIDKVKIDQNFVRHLVNGSSDAAIIHAIIAMSRSLKLEIIAEGIETAMQREFLIAEGCRMGQGYFFSLPLPAAEIGQLLRQGCSLPVPA